MPPPYVPAPPPPAAPSPGGILNRRQTISNRASTITLGVLALVAAALSLTAALAHDRGIYELGARLFLAGVGLTCVVLGIVLAVTALRGRSGGWLTLVSAILAGIFVPIALIVGLVAGTSHYSPNGWGGASSSGTLVEEEDDSSWDWELEDEDWAGSETADPVFDLVDEQRTFDHETADIYAKSSQITIDLTEAPDFQSSYVYADVAESDLTVLLTPDQAVSISLTMYDSALETQMPQDALAENPWLATLSTLETLGFVDSDNYLRNGYRGVLLGIYADHSTVIFQVIDNEEPQS